MSGDEGRVVTHFGREYVWSRTEAGNLSLVSLDALTESVAEIVDVLKARA